jgi:hypothetical protein
MRCPDYGTPNCDGSLCSSFAECRYGWIPYWTPAERAGLKQMGHDFLNAKYRMECNHNKKVKIVRAIVCSAIRDSIQSFVAAARKAKGE